MRKQPVCLFFLQTTIISFIWASLFWSTSWNRERVTYH